MTELELAIILEDWDYVRKLLDGVVPEERLEAVIAAMKGDVNAPK